MRVSPILTSLAVPVFCLVAGQWVAAAEPPEKALKYHEVLLKRPHNVALFDRFYGSWLDEQPVESMGEFLISRATANGGAEWGVLATYQLRRGDEDGALESLGKAIAALPEEPALAMERAKLHLRRLEFVPARTDLAQVASGKDEALALEAAKLTGKSWLREGNVEKAVESWNAVLAAHPADEDLLEDLVETAAAESQMDQALDYISKLISVTRDPYQKTLRMLRRGDLLSQAGKNDEAVAAYAETLDKVGTASWLEHEVIAQIEKLFRRQDRIDDLMAELEKLGKQYPQRLAIQRQLAKLEASHGSVDSAIGRFREVLKRSPGERELREEFIRMLIDGERYDDAVAELGKLIEATPADPELRLQVAALRSREGKPLEVRASLDKAYELLGKDEAAGIRIAGLMLQYGLTEPGEAMLKKLADDPKGGPVAKEVLAAHYGQTQRKAEAIALLKKAGAGPDLDVFLRTAGSIAGLGENAAAYEVLAARAVSFSGEPKFLAALAQAGLTVDKSVDVMPHAMKLVRLSKQAADLAESINLAQRVIAAAKKEGEIREALAGQVTRTASETCLLAAILDGGGDTGEVEKLLDAQTNPMVVHFHAALLDRRGEFDQAIAVLSRLAGTEEGRKAAYFKDLSELQQRAGKSADALATVERWKLAAPGDKTAWITGSRLLREAGKPEESVKMTRQAVARFEGDTDLEASLASLHQEAGQWADAEAIYWKLYDAGESPLDQARWAAQLAQLAQRSGKTAELEEKFQERAKGNRRSIGPILAQAELARLTNQDDKRRDLLLEAVRLQPKDLDLRMQIAEVEEKAGNPERVVAVLEEALPFDVNGRVRNSLAQSYLRQGQTVKGMRELRMLSGKTGFDARSAESAAGALADAKLYDEAIQVLRSELKDGGDWRSDYLLAALLEEDGREAEALPMFLKLLAAEGDIASLSNPFASANKARNPNRFSKEMESMTKIFQAKQFAYANRGQSGGGVSFGQTGTRSGGFYLPDSAEDVRRLALMHLCTLATRNPAKRDDELISRIKAASTSDPSFVLDVVGDASTDDNGNVNYTKLLQDHPDEPGLLEWTLYYGQMQQTMTPEALRKLLTGAKGLSAASKFSGLSRLVGMSKSDEDWKLWLEAAKAMAHDPSPDSAINTGYQLLNSLQLTAGGIPEKLREPAKELLVECRALVLKEHPDFENYNFLIGVAAVAESPAAWLEQVNSAVRKWQKSPPALQQGNVFNSQAYQFGRIRMGGGQEIFSVPKLETAQFRSMPYALLASFNSANQNSDYTVSPISVEDLVKSPAKIESPFLRAWLAVKSGNAAAIKSAMAVEPPKAEAADFEVLRAVVLMTDGKPVEAFNLLAKARDSAGPERNYRSWLELSLIGIASTMTPEQRAAKATDLQAVLLRARQSLGPQYGPALAAQAKSLGLMELAARLDAKGVAGPSATAGATTGPAVMASSQSSSYSRNNSAVNLEKVRKYVSLKKHEAAAREVLLAIRSQRPEQRSYFMSSELQTFLAILGKDGKEALVKLVAPGDSKSLVKRMEFIEICDAVGKPELATPFLEELSRERADDPEIAARLVFLIPPDQTDRWLQLINVGCHSELLASQAAIALQNPSTFKDNAAKLDYFERVTRWLETAEPTRMMDANLTWVTYSAKRLLTGSDNGGGNSMVGELPKPAEGSEKKPTPDQERTIALCKRLSLALLRHPGTAEEGFRMLTASNAWKIEPAAKDDYARQALLTTALRKGDRQSRRYGEQAYFQLRSNNGGSSEGSNLDEFSTAAWLQSRVDELKDFTAVFPSDWMGKLVATDPRAADLKPAFSANPKPADFAGIWNSEIFTAQYERLGGLLKPIVMKRFLSSPDAAKMLAEQISKIAPGTAAGNPGNPAEPANQFMIQSALTVAAGMPDEKGLETVAKAAKRAIFGEDFNFSTSAPQTVPYERMNFLESIVRNDQLPAESAVRLYRTLFRLKLPSSNGTYAAVRPFQNKRFSKMEEAIAFYESLGWLTEVDKWEPYAVMSSQQNSSPTGNGYLITIKPALVLEQAIQYTRYGSVDLTALVKTLKERKQGRFGSLMLAAALSSGTERTTLASLAFTESSSGLSKLSAERLESLALIVPWLSDEARKKLPKPFATALKNLEEQNRANAVARADEFLKSNSRSGNNSSYYQAGEILGSIVPYDPDKAVEVFIAAEKDFTASLLRGGNLAYTTYNQWQIPGRDAILMQLSNGNGEESRRVQDVDLDRWYKFLDQIMRSDCARRLTLVGSNGPDSSFFTNLAAMVSQQSGGDLFANANSSKVIAGGIVKSWEIYQAGKTRRPRSLWIPTFLLYGDPGNSFGAPDADTFRSVADQLAKLTAKDPDAAAIGRVRMAFWGWTRASDVQKAEMRRALVSFLADEGLPDQARLELAARWLKTIPKAEAIDEPFCAALTKLYQNYCRAGRSAITPISETLFESLPKNPGGSEHQVKLAADLSLAFWENAESPNAAGHPQIPATLGREAFLLAAVGGNRDLVSRSFTRVKGEMTGDLTFVISLLCSDQFEFVRQVLPAAGDMFTLRGETSVTYTRRMESALAAWEKSGADPPALQKIELEMIGLKRAEGEEAPKEEKAALLARAKARFLANRPPSPADQWALQQFLTADLQAPELLPLLKEWVAKHPLGDFLIMDSRGSNEVNSRPRRAAVVLHGIAAGHGLAAGDTTALKGITEAIGFADQTGNRSSYYYAYQDLQRLNTFMAITLRGDIAAGKHDGLAKAWPDYRAYVVTLSKLYQNQSPSAIQTPLALAGLFAADADGPARMTDLCESLGERFKGYVSQFGGKAGFAAVVGSIRSDGSDGLPESATPEAFLTEVLRMPEFASMYPADPGWFEFKNQIDALKALEKLALDPPAGTIPEAMPGLHESAGNRKLDKSPDEAIAAFRKGLESCPAGDEWNHARGALKWKLANTLHSQKQTEESKKIFSSIAEPEIAEWLKGRYESLSAKLNPKETKK